MHENSRPIDPSSKVDTSIIDPRRSTHRSSIFESRHTNFRWSTHRPSILEGRHIDLRRSKAETSHRHSDNSSPNIVHNGAPWLYTQDSVRYIRILDGTQADICTFNNNYSATAHTCTVMYYTPTYIAYMR